jgi:DNA replication licensing factor MCM2
MRISEAFAKMRLGEYCSNGDIDRAIAVTVDSFVGSQKVSAKKALARAFAKYTLRAPGRAGGARGGAGGGRGGRGVAVAA